MTPQGPMPFVPYPMMAGMPAEAASPGQANPTSSALQVAPYMMPPPMAYSAYGPMVPGQHGMMQPWHQQQQQAVAPAGPQVSEIEPADAPQAQGTGWWAQRPRSAGDAASMAASAALSGMLITAGVGMAGSSWLAASVRRQLGLVSASASRVVQQAGQQEAPSVSSLLLTQPPAGNPTLLLTALPSRRYGGAGGSPPGSPPRSQRLHAGPLPARASSSAAARKEEEPLLDVADSLAHVVGLWLGLTLCVGRLAARVPLMAATMWLSASARAWHAASRVAAAAAGQAGQLVLVVTASSLRQLADSHILLPNALLLPVTALLWHGASAAQAVLAWVMVVLARLVGDSERATPEAQTALALSLATKQQAATVSTDSLSRFYDVDAAPQLQVAAGEGGADVGVAPAARAAAAAQRALAPLQLWAMDAECALGSLRSQLQQQDPRQLQLVPVITLAMAAGRQALVLASSATAAALAMAEAGALWAAAQAARGAPAVARDMLRAYVVSWAWPGERSGGCVPGWPVGRCAAARPASCLNSLLPLPPLSFCRATCSPWCAAWVRSLHTWRSSWPPCGSSTAAAPAARTTDEPVPAASKRSTPNDDCHASEHLSGRCTTSENVPIFCLVVAAAGVPAVACALAMAPHCSNVDMHGRSAPTRSRATCVETGGFTFAT